MKTFTSRLLRGLPLGLALLASCKSGSKSDSPRPRRPDSGSSQWESEEIRLPSRKEDKKQWSREGLYVGFAFTYQDVLGDFQDGDLILVDPNATQAIFVPELDASEGYGAFLSYRWTNWEMLFNYEQFEHDGSFTGGGNFDTDFRYFDVMFRRYWWADKAIQPFLTIGAGIATAEVNNGTSDGINTRDSELEAGLTFNAGGGLAFYPLPWVSIYGQGIYRFGRFPEADGINGRLPIEHDLDSDAWEISAGMSLRILRHR